MPLKERKVLRLNLLKKWVFVVFCLSLPVLTFSLNRLEIELRRKEPIEKWGRAVLEGLPQGAVVVTSGDLANFTLGYLTKAARLRPDVIVLDPMDSFTPRELHHIGWPFLTYEAKNLIRREQIGRFLREGRSVYGVFFTPTLIPEGWSQQSDGFLHRLVPKEAKKNSFPSRLREAEDFFNKNIQPLNMTRLGWGPTLRALLSNAIGFAYKEQFERAFHVKERKAPAEGMVIFSQYSPLLRVVLARMHIGTGSQNYTVASDLLRRSLRYSWDEWLPEIPDSWYWLAYLDLEVNDPSSALYHADQALRLDPSLVEVEILRGIAFEKIGRVQEAQRAYRRAIKINPSMKEKIPKDSFYRKSQRSLSPPWTL